MKPAILNFTSRLKQPSFALDATPFISLGLIALFFLFASNSLFVSPGLAMDLADMPEANQETPSRPPNSVLTIYSPSVFFFEGQNLNALSLEQAITDFVDRHPDQEILLLLRANRILSLEQLTPILNVLDKAGVHRVMLETQTTANRITP